MSKEQSGHKKDREFRAAPKILADVGRRLLKEPAPDSKDPRPWGVRIMTNLYEIACRDVSVSSFQAIKLAVEITGRQWITKRTSTKLEEDSEAATVAGLSEEELDAEIAEIQAQLGSLASPDE